MHVHIKKDYLLLTYLRSLQYRRLRMDLIMTYKILHGTVHLRKDHFLL